MLDCHVHIMKRDQPQPDNLALSLSRSGMTGAVLISPPPPSFTRVQAGPTDAGERLACVLEWCRNRANFFPFFWLDPLEYNAGRQIDEAFRAGIAGFKIICTQAGPEHTAVQKAARQIAATGRPLLFHSGILWDGYDSSRFNRPAGFEALLRIPQLRFALAHASWPWIDECLAVFGKFQQARRQAPDQCAEMFIDLTPGTPRIYRDELYRKLLGIGYPLADHILFGTDNVADDYNEKYAADWLQLDRRLLDQYGSGEGSTDAGSADRLERSWRALTETNLRRFIEGSGHVIHE